MTQAKLHIALGTEISPEVQCVAQTELLDLSPRFLDLKLGEDSFAYRVQNWKDVKVGLLVAKPLGHGEGL